MWKVIDSLKKNAKELMDFDSNLLNSMNKEDLPTIHFYDFLKPTFTFGVFIQTEKIMNESFYLKTFDFSKRPTGGGVLFHVWDFAFSCFVPKNHEGYVEDVMKSYQYINEKIAFALFEFLENKDKVCFLLPEEIEPIDPLCKNFCFAKPTKYDIMYEGKKLAGAAQRRKAAGYLHQGSISLLMPDFTLLSPLFDEKSAVISAMELYTHPLLGKGSTLKDKKDARELIKQKIINSLNS